MAYQCDHRTPSSGPDDCCSKCGMQLPTSAMLTVVHWRLCEPLARYRLEKERQRRQLNASHVDNNTPKDEDEDEDEDEVFYDAVSYFADINTTTITEGASVNVHESECTTDNVKEDAPADITTPEVILADDSTDEADKQDPLNPGTAADLLGSNPAVHNHISSSNGYSAEKSKTATISRRKGFKSSESL